MDRIQGMLNSLSRWRSWWKYSKT